MSYSSLRAIDLDFIGGAWQRRRSYGHYTPRTPRAVRLPPLNRSRTGTQQPFWLEDRPQPTKPPTPFWLDETSPLRSNSYQYTPFVRRQNKYNNFRGADHNPYLLDENPLLQSYVEGPDHTPLWASGDISQLVGPELDGEDDDDAPFWVDDITRQGAQTSTSFYSRRYKKYAGNGPDLTPLYRRESSIELDQTPFWLDESSALRTGRTSVISRLSGPRNNIPQYVNYNQQNREDISVKPKTPLHREESCPDWLDYKSPYTKKNTQQTKEPTIHPLRKDNWVHTYTSLNQDKIRREGKSAKPTKPHNKPKTPEKVPETPDGYISESPTFLAELEKPESPLSLKGKLYGEHNQETPDSPEALKTKLYGNYQKKVKELSLAAENEAEEHLATRKPAEPVSTEGLQEIAGPDWSDTAENSTQLFYL